MLPPFHPTPLTLVFVALAVASVALAGVLAVLQARGRRIPLSAWLALPAILATTGTLGGAYLLREALATLPTAAPELRGAVAGAGLATGAATWALGWEWTLVALLATTWIAAAGTLFGSREARWRWIPPLAVVGAVACAAGLQQAAEMALHQATIGPAVTVLAGLPIAIVLLRRDASASGVPARTTALVLAFATASLAAFLMFSAGWSQAAWAWARSSAETKHAWRAGAVALSYSGVWIAGGSGLAVGAIAWIARRTWIRRADEPQAAGGIALALLLLFAPATGSLLGWGPAGQLWAISGDVFWYPASDALRFPVVPLVRQTRHRPVVVLVDRRSVVVSGEWLFDLDRHEADGAIRSELPAGAEAKLAGLGTKLAGFRGADEPPLVQVDRDLAWSEVGPVFQAIAAAGIDRVEVVAVGADAVGVVSLALPIQPPPEPGDSVEAVLGRHTD